MEHKLLVPVRTTAAGTLALRTGRLPSGERSGLAFTCQDALVRALGPSQQWTDLSWEALLTWSRRSASSTSGSIRSLTADPGQATRRSRRRPG